MPSFHSSFPRKRVPLRFRILFPVAPAQAGAHKPLAVMDYRFRGNDGNAKGATGFRGVTMPCFVGGLSA